MVWTAPATATVGQILTAAFMNAQLRDNMLQTAPALVTTDGDMVVATAANTLKRLAAFSGDVLLHDIGGLEFDASAVTTNDGLGGASSGVMEIKTPVTQGEAEAGTNTRFSLWSSERVKQAITALQGGHNIASHDDAEIGTFTPTLQDDTRSDGESQTYSYQIGRYLKVGRVVHIMVSILLTSLGSLTTSQQAVIAGMPFTALNTANVRSPMSFGNLSGLALPAAGNELMGFIEPNTTVVGLSIGDATAGQSLMTIAEFSANGGMSFSGSYEV